MSGQSLMQEMERGCFELARTGILAKTLES